MKITQLIIDNYVFNLEKCEFCDKKHFEEKIEEIKEKIEDYDNFGYGAVLDFIGEYNNRKYRFLSECKAIEIIETELIKE